MNALNDLRAEHRLITQVLDRFDALTRAGDELPAGYIEALLDFLRFYVDANHHGKEERALFQRLAGDPAVAGFAAMLTADHDEGRTLLGAIERAASQGRPVSNAIGVFSNFIRDHMRREDEMIFQAIEHVLSASAMTALEAEFLAIEIKVLGSSGITGSGDRATRISELRRWDQLISA